MIKKKNIFYILQMNKLRITASCVLFYKFDELNNTSIFYTDGELSFETHVNKIVVIY